MNLMTPEQWAMHINAVNDYHDDAAQEEVIWRRNITTLSLHGEDDNIQYVDVTLKVLVYYNVFRSWPIDQSTDSGDIDKQSCMLYINKKWLRDQGYLNEKDQFEFNPDFDRFIVNGNSFMPSGDSDISQAHADPLLIFIILKKEIVNTGTVRYPDNGT